MKLLLFNQYDRLLAKFKAIASDCARDAADWKICRVSASSGIVHLHDRTMNVLTVSGGEAFETADAGSLLPPLDGQTVIYRFTETLGDRLYVERKVVGYADC